MFDNCSFILNTATAVSMTIPADTIQATKRVPVKRELSFFLYIFNTGNQLVKYR